jgi:ABC-type glycerol-3-phosphate transport system substrate-binding protein
MLRIRGCRSEFLSPYDPAVLFHPWFMFYRKDVLAAKGLLPPESWEEVLLLATQLNGTDVDGDGVGDHALCFNTKRNCQVGCGNVLQHAA